MFIGLIAFIWFVPKHFSNFWLQEIFFYGLVFAMLIVISCTLGNFFVNKAINHTIIFIVHFFKLVIYLWQISLKWNKVFQAKFLWLSDESIISSNEHRKHDQLLMSLSTTGVKFDDSTKLLRCSLKKTLYKISIWCTACSQIVYWCCQTEISSKPILHQNVTGAYPEGPNFVLD